MLELGRDGLRSGLIEQIFKTAGGYPYVSVNAYNPWALAEVDGNGHRRERRLGLRRGRSPNPAAGRPVVPRGVP